MLVSLERPPVRVRLAQSYESSCRAACQAAWPRFRLSLTLSDWRGIAAVELRAASGRVLDRSRRPGLPLPMFGDELGWAIYRGRCWWTFRRRQGCEGCGGLRCVCEELAQAASEQLELAAWLASRGYE